MILAEIRDAVRVQLDLPDEEDLPTSLLDSYIAEGFNNIINREARWPFLQTQWVVQSVADVPSVVLPADVGSIDSVVRGGVVLDHVAHSDAEERFGDFAGSPEMYSVWGGSLYFWPRPTGVDSYTIRGWRLASEAWVSAAGSEPDTGAERRLDRALVHYACYRAYSQQEDPELAEFYRVSFERVVGEAAEAIMRPRFHGKLIMGKGVPRRRRRWVNWALD